MAKQFIKPQNYRDFRGPWRLKHLSFFTNHLKLVNSIPSFIKIIFFLLDVTELRIV